MALSRDYHLNYWKFGKEPLVILQTEASECGLACVAMIANYHGYEANLISLRKNFSISLKGSTLADVINIAKSLKLTGRPLQLELDELKELKCPCILHWDLNHFVVLVKVKSNKVIINDPAVGKRQLTFAEVSKHFTGIALELTKDVDFEHKKIKENIDIYKLFSDIKGLKTNIIALIMIALIIEILSLFNPFLMQWSIDKVVPFNDKNLLSLLIIGFSIALVVNRLLAFCQEWVALYFSNNLKLELETRIFSNLIDLPLSYFQKRHLGDIVSRFNSIHNIQALFTTQFIGAILDGFFAVLTLVLMFLYSVKLTVIVILFLVVYIIIRWVYYRPLKNLSLEKLVFSSKKDTYFLETIRGIRSIQFFNKQSQRMSQWLNTYVKEININVKSHKLTMIFTLLNGLLFGFENLLIIWLGIGKVLEGAFTVGVFIAFMSYKDQFKDKLNSLIDNYISYRLLDVDKERIADIIFNEEKRLTGKEFFNVNLMKDNSVSIVNLSFKYSQNERLILENLNIKIASNEFVAITGASGRGKSTLMNIIAGINQPTSGDVLMGGVSSIDLRLPNQLVTMVSQDDTLYAGSILENICFFDQNINIEWAEECAKMACIHHEIIQMPMGYETLVGDMGTVLSGGQKQRLFIARALYFKPKILLLDEATSHLDVANENYINTVLKQIPITRIVIAHRRETIEAADRTIEL